MLPLTELSKIGLGTYRMKRTDEHRAALAEAVSLGVNIFDTASNYCLGESEKLIGDFLKEADREKFFVITKAGYITPTEKQRMNYLLRKGMPAESVIQRDTTLHCIHPDFLRLQLRQSLRRLNSRYVDAFLIHSPDYQYTNLSDPSEKSLYHSKIQAAFSFLEEMAHKGIVRYYGISSNSLPLTGNVNRTVLDDMLEISKDVASNNRFKLIQFPYNLVEHTASVSASEPSLIAQAKAAGLITLANRPFTANTSQGVVMLNYQDQPDRFDQPADLEYEKFAALMGNHLEKLGLPAGFENYDALKMFSRLWNSVGNRRAADMLYYDYLPAFLSMIYSGKRKGFIIASMPAELKLCLQRLYDYSKQYAELNLRNRSNEYLASLVKNNVIGDEELQNLPEAACRRYLDAGINCVLAGMTKAAYARNLAAVIR